MTEYAAENSQFDKDLDSVMSMIDYLQCYVMYPENNPLVKKDILKVVKSIQGRLSRIERYVMFRGWDYFTQEVTE